MRSVPCSWCGKRVGARTMEVDRHPIPGYLGGTYRRGNVVPSCAKCNRTGRCVNRLALIRRAMDRRALQRHFDEFVPEREPLYPRDLSIWTTLGRHRVDHRWVPIVRQATWSSPVAPPVALTCLRVIAEELGVSTERARQIELVALRKLRFRLAKLGIGPEPQPEPRSNADKVEHVRRGVPRAGHVCHAEGCNIPVKPAFLMCPKHWRMVPRAIQLKVWQEYSPGQEEGKADVTGAYLEVMNAAIEAVATKEGCRG